MLPTTPRRRELGGATPVCWRWHLAGVYARIVPLELLHMQARKERRAQ